MPNKKCDDEACDGTREKDDGKFGGRVEEFLGGLYEPSVAEAEEAKEEAERGREYMRQVCRSLALQEKQIAVGERVCVALERIADRLGVMVGRGVSNHDALLRIADRIDAMADEFFKREI